VHVALQAIAHEILFHSRNVQAYYLHAFVFTPFFIELCQPFYSWTLELELHAFLLLEDDLLLVMPAFQDIAIDL